MTGSARDYLLWGTLAWLPMPVLAVANAALRETVLLPLLGVKSALSLSGVTLIAILAVYAFAVFRLGLPSAGRAAAWLLGIVWAGLTLAFEYALIAASQDRPLARLAETLSPAALSEGNLFVLAVMLLALAPRLFHRSAEKR